MVEASDEKLIEQYLKGDEKSLEILINRHLKPVYIFVYRLVGSQSEAEDVTQVVFVKIWKNIKKFDTKKSFKTWMYRITHNTAIDYLRKKKAVPFSAFENEEGENPVLDSLVDLAPLPDQQPPSQ